LDSGSIFAFYFGVPWMISIKMGSDLNR